MEPRSRKCCLQRNRGTLPVVPVRDAEAKVQRHVARIFLGPRQLRLSHADITMLLTVAEAGTALGCSPRAVRASLGRGEIQGQKQDGQRRIPRGNMPLTEAQHRTLQARVGAVRELVEDVLPPRLA